MPTSPDIRVVAPASLVLELQARSIFGTQDSLFSANIVDDLDRVRDGRADAFILAADGILSPFLERRSSVLREL